MKCSRREGKRPKGGGSDACLLAHLARPPSERRGPLQSESATSSGSARWEKNRRCDRPSAAGLRSRPNPAGRRSGETSSPALESLRLPCPAGRPRWRQLCRLDRHLGDQIRDFSRPAGRFSNLSDPTCGRRLGGAGRPLESSPLRPPSARRLPSGALAGSPADRRVIQVACPSDSPELLDREISPSRRVPLRGGRVISPLASSSPHRRYVVEIPGSPIRAWGSRPFLRDRRLSIIPSSRPKRKGMGLGLVHQ
jgi:hypothetical protein